VPRPQFARRWAAPLLLLIAMWMTETSLSPAGRSETELVLLSLPSIYLLHPAAPRLVKLRRHFGRRCLETMLSAERREKTSQPARSMRPDLAEILPGQGAVHRI
jgi:hypothetical protein